MPNLFRTGDGTSEETILIALELIGEDWCKRALIGALELMCDPNNWTERGSASVDFAADKANEMVENLEIEVIIPDGNPIGAMQMWITDEIPPKWLICDGQAVSRATYAELFEIWGVSFGSGDGTTTFNLPDFRFRSPMGAGLSPDATVNLGVGGISGAQNQSLSGSNLPAHNHNVATATGGAAGANNVIVASIANVNTTPTQKATSSTGSGTPFSVVHPVTGVHMIVYAGA